MDRNANPLGGLLPSGQAGEARPSRPPSFDGGGWAEAASDGIEAVVPAGPPGQPQRMHAITFAAPHAAFEDATLPDPGPPEGHDLLIAVEAIGINPLDLKQHDGPPRVLGVDAAGVVLAAGPLARGFGPGDRVVCLAPPNRPGAYAQKLLVDGRLAGRIPETLSFADAAALPCAGLTAWEALFERLRVTREGSLLVLGAAGGVGSMAVQLARGFGMARVVGTAARPESRAWVERMGADAVLDHASDLPAQARAAKLRFDHIFVTQGTERHWPALTAMLAPRGSICAIDQPGALEMAALRAKGGGFLFEALFAKALSQAPDMATQGATLTALAADHRLLPTITRNPGRICAAHVAVCHAWIAEGRMLGKAVLEGW